MSALLSMVPLPAWGAAFVVTVIGVVQFREVRRERREAAADAMARHPSQQSRRHVPGLPVDGEPLTEEPGGEAEQLAALWYVLNHLSIPEPGQQTSASEEAE